jgi:hypothetical protein
MNPHLLAKLARKGLAIPDFVLQRPDSGTPMSVASGRRSMGTDDVMPSDGGTVGAINVQLFDSRNPRVAPPVEYATTFVRPTLSTRLPPLPVAATPRQGLPPLETRKRANW